MKPTILISIPHYLPGWRFGGPTTTISNLVFSLGAEFDFKIFTSDRDFGESTAYPDVKSDQWTNYDAAQVYYASKKSLTFGGIVRFLSETPYDLLYLNSFFRPEFSTIPLIVRRLGLLPDRPCVLAPRGEFSPAALAIKGNKKRAFLALSRALSLHRNIRWQASSDFEAADIRRIVKASGGNIVVAPNLPRKANASPMEDLVTLDEEGHLRVVCIARIAPMKNIHFALEVLKDSPVPVKFEIWGTIENKSYWQRCELIMAEMPPHVMVEYRGPAMPADIDSILLGADLMFMPSLGENFGQSIVESFVNGTPVLISDRTPWRDLQVADAGWDLPIDQGPGIFRQALKSAHMRCRHDRTGWRASVRNYAGKKLFKADAVEANRRLFALY